MRVLWFEVSIPANFEKTNNVVLGWQDSLEQIVKKCSEIELFIAFEYEGNENIKRVEGVTYIPMNTSYSFWERKRNDMTWNINEQKVVENGIKVIEKYKPDIVHVFGNEWPFGLIAKYTEVPFVIHIQGSIIPYNNALYPPEYNELTFVLDAGLNIRKQWQIIKKHLKDVSRLKMEQRIWETVPNYMGRTEWDKALVYLLHPGATYHHVDEALRPIFTKTNKRWKHRNNKKLKLITTGCSSFWKGIDVMLKTAHILKKAKIDFEWNVAGSMPNSLRQVVENKEHLKFAENNVNILGYTSPDRLVDLLCESSMYVHTAYIENSPNSICEAQILGTPVVSTMVGGISTLVRYDIDGKLLPANDPWQIAYNIIALSKDKERMNYYSSNSMKIAQQRHASCNILKDLLECYKSIINNKM